MKLFYLLPFFLFACATSNNMKNTDKNTGKEVTIVGTADHAKMGAVVINASNTFYIEGKLNWDKEGYYKKQVKVTGTLETKTLKAEDLKNEKGEIIQGAAGEITYIKMSKCELVK